MKYLYYYLPLFLLLSFIISSCDEDTTGPGDGDGAEGSVFVQSNPSGAEIFIGGSSRGFTPDTIQGLSAGNVEIRLELNEYSDTTFSVTVQEDQVVSTGVIQLRSDVSVLRFGPVRIWETTGTTALQPSGLDLSSGTAYGISGDSAAVVDIYYFSNSAGPVFEIRSADDLLNNNRGTAFNRGNSSDLDDGVNSQSAVPTWGDSMGDREGNYVFLFDSDSHYSKIKIVDFGQADDGDAWVEIEWIYNTVANDTRFP